MSALLLIVAANVAYLVIEVARLLRIERRKQNFESVRLAASSCAREGWVPLRVTWHGFWRTEPHMAISHPDRPGEFTLRLS